MRPLGRWSTGRESLAEIMFKYTAYVMYFAPLGVGAAMAVTVGEQGTGGSVQSRQADADAVRCAVHLCGRGPWRSAGDLPNSDAAVSIEAVKEPLLLAFSTASSEAALPSALENMEKFGVPKHIVGFVLPTGYSFNLDGTTLYLSLASIFVAQAAGVDMPFGTQILMMLTLMLTSKGVAGVPRASLVVLAGTLATFNLPIEGSRCCLGSTR